MKKFTDKTNSLKEPAIKTGNFVPKDAVNLGWFSGREINPKNNISIVDLSSMTPENINSRNKSNTIMYANELGILEDIDGNTFVESDDVSVSSIFLNQETVDRKYNINDTDSLTFAHSYYVSRFFTLIQSKVHGNFSIDDFLEDKYLPNNIKVLDEDGNLYADSETGIKKYRILLESFVTNTNSFLNDIPHRIIVLLDDPDPKNLKIVYDKVEANADGTWYGQQLRYQENINTVPIFDEIQEESEVIDYSNQSKKIYSVKRNSKKALVDGYFLDSPGNQIYTNKKSIDDNRIYEVFNWRLVAKVQNSVNFSRTNYGSGSGRSNILEKVVNIGVLYSSNVGKNLAKIKPYVALNVQNSPFNLAGFSFSNPLNTGNQRKSKADYWLVDIDSVSDLSMFDVLFFCPHWSITDSQAQKINKTFIEKNGTLILDASGCALNDMLSLNRNLNISNNTAQINPSTYNLTNIFIDKNKNNGYSISNSQFIENCGIFGFSKDVNDNYKNYKYFTNTNLTSVLSNSNTGQPGQNFVVSLRNSPETNNLVAGNIVASTAPIFDYCNNIYSGSNLNPTDNYQDVSIPVNSTTGFSSYVEGPYKFIYNCILVAINDRVESSKVKTDVRSSVHYFTTDWNNNWVINSNVLFEEEKAKYFSNITNNNETILARNIIDSPKSYYIEQIKKIISSYQDRFFDQDQNNTTFYIEYTNNNISWTNSSSVSDLEKNEISSSYEIVKIDNKQSACYVYTEKESPFFLIPSGFGPHIIKEKIIDSKVNKLSSFSSNPPQNYNFSLQLNHSLTTGSDSARVFSASVKTNSIVRFTQKNTYDELVTPERPARGAYVDYNSPISTPGPVTVGADINYRPISLLTTESNYGTPVTNPLSCFVYTGDIAEGNTWDEYFQDKAGMQASYIKYIQLTLNHAGYPTAVDGSFKKVGKQDSATHKNIKLFQASRGMKEDGIVDSRTKEALAFVWAEKNADSLEKTRVSVVDKNNYKDKKIWDYIKRASEISTASSSIVNNRSFRMINFTGSSKAVEEIRMWVGFQIPNNDSIDFSNLDKVPVIKISTSSSFSPSSTNYQGVKILDWRLGNSFYTGAPGSDKKTGFVKGGDLTIKLTDAQCKGQFISILLLGSDLNNSAFGPKAAGIAIDGITLTYKMKDTPTTTISYPTIPAIPYQAPVYASRDETLVVEGIVDMNSSFNGVSFSGLEKQITTADLKNYGILKSITLYEKVGNRLNATRPITYNNLNVPLNNVAYKPDPNRSEIVDISNPNIIRSLNSAEVVPNSVRERQMDIPATDESVVATRKAISFNGATNHLVKVSTVLANYNNTTTYYNPDPSDETQGPLTGYKLKKFSTGQIIDGKNHTNYYDGILLLCKQNGTPFGFEGLNPSAISSNISQDMDAYYSNIKVSGLNGTDKKGGLEYGFFDISTKEFIGKEITYLRYIKNPQDIFIAVFAYDYDGNLSTQKEFTSASSSSIYTPTQVPTRAAYPVFNVITNNKNKIQISGVSPNLSKTDPWPITITSGSFNKEVSLANDKAVDWKLKYNGQTLTAIYDTSSISSVAWSKIFGRGYYDVVGEKPVYNGPRSITLRQVPVHVVKTYSSDFTRKNSPLKPQVKVYTRESVNQSWNLVPYSSIEDINCKTGVIEFNNSIVPNDQNLIKVDYTIKQKNINVKQSNGSPIPTNPFLNADEIKINKPLYIYLMPKTVYKTAARDGSNGEIVAQDMKKVVVEEYTNQSLVNYTYDNNIFNKLDPFSYDPFALLIGIIYVINTKDDENFTFSDLRVKGGGISANFDTNNVIDALSQSVSFWDVYPPMAEAYPKGGYVMIKIPTSVKKNFTNPQEVYDIVRANLTAGVAFDLLDMDGNDWSSSVTISS
jgi:hypothetical protein